jgi:mRNA interferase MazF
MRSQSRGGPDPIRRRRPLTRTVRGVVSELALIPADGVPTDCVVNFYNVHTIARTTLRRMVAALPRTRWPQVCRTLQAATGC